MPRSRRRGVTTAPRVLPLLPIGFVGMFVAYRTLDVLSGLWVLLQLPVDAGTWAELGDPGAGDVVLRVAIDVALIVVASLLLRWLVRRWVVAQPPEAV